MLRPSEEKHCMEWAEKRRGGGGKSGRGAGEGVPGPALVLLVWLLVVGPGLGSTPARSRRLRMTQRGRREEKGGRGRQGLRVSGCQAEALREKTAWGELEGGGGEGSWLAGRGSCNWPGGTGVPPPRRPDPGIRGPSTSGDAQQLDGQQLDGS